MKSPKCYGILITDLIVHLINGHICSDPGDHVGPKVYLASYIEEFAKLIIVHLITKMACHGLCGGVMKLWFASSNNCHN